MECDRLPNTDRLWEFAARLHDAKTQRNDLGRQQEVNYLLFVRLWRQRQANRCNNYVEQHGKQKVGVCGPHNEKHISALWYSSDNHRRKTERQRGRGRPRRTWVDDLRDWTGSKRYDQIKRAAERRNLHGTFATHQQWSQHRMMNLINLNNLRCRCSNWFTLRIKMYECMRLNYYSPFVYELYKSVSNIKKSYVTEIYKHHSVSVI